MFIIKRWLRDPDVQAKALAIIAIACIVTLAAIGLVLSVS